MLPDPEQFAAYAQLVSTFALAVFFIWTLFFERPRARKETAEEFERLRKLGVEERQIIEDRWQTTFKELHASLESQKEYHNVQVLELTKAFMRLDPKGK